MPGVDSILSVVWIHLKLSEVMILASTFLSHVLPNARFIPPKSAFRPFQSARTRFYPSLNVLCTVPKRLHNHCHCFD